MSRKKAFNLLSLCLLAVLFYSCGSNAFKGIADDSSQEACRYEVTKNLDSGNWDAVLNSSCADSMQKGAAYFGRAGFDIKDVINRLSEASGEEEGKDLNIYLKALVPKVTEQTLNDLSMAKSEYGNVSPKDPHYKDAQFYISLVDTSYSLSLMKIVIDSDGDGAISNCDINGNGVPDDADATACALMASGQSDPTSGNCGSSISANYTATTDITFNGKSGTYRGLTINITGSGGTCPTTYKNLLYKNKIDGKYYYYVATTSGTCTAINDGEWPCPIEQNGEPLDLVSAIDESINSAINFLSNALPSDVDVTQAIKEIRDKACGGDTCTSQEIANYIQQYLSTQ
jgi:hypothetical protein